MPKTKDTAIQFNGYSKPNYTMVPDELFDEQLPYLSGAELKVLLYIIRRTFGFKKDSDNVSLQQMTSGIVTKDGKVLDKGTGLSKAAVAIAVKTLEEKGLIIRNRRRSTEKGDEPTTYALNILPLSNKWTPPSPENGHPPVQSLDTQNTDIQETVKQEIYLSNLRRGENEKNDYVNPVSSTSNSYIVEYPTAGKDEEHSTQERTMKSHEANDGAPGTNKEPSNYHHASQSHTTQPTPPAREETHKVHTRGTAPGGFTSIREMLPQEYLPQTIPDEEARDALRDYIRDIGGKLHDEAPLEHSTTRAFNLYQRSGLDLSSFFNQLYDAEKEANRRSTTIKKQRADGVTNRMPYFFSVLEDKLHLRPKDTADTPQRS